MANVRVRRRVRGASIAPPPIAFAQITTLKSNTSGEHWVTPFGIPIPRSVNVNSTYRTKMFAQISGVKYPIQTEKFIERADGNLHWCAGHFKIPAGVSPGTKIDIGYSDTEAVPSTPDWTTLWSGGHDLVLNLSIYEPRVWWVCIPDTYSTATPLDGDVLTLTLTDDIGAQTFTMRFDRNSIRGFMGGDFYYNFWVLAAKMIETTPGSRWKAIDDLAVPVRAWNRPWAVGYDTFGSRYSNSSVGPRNGMDLNAPGRMIYRSPRYQTSGAGTWPRYGFYIWPRHKAGNPHASTLEFSITRNGTALPVTTIGNAGVCWTKLNYDAQTAEFTAGTYVVGQTSDACGYIEQVIDNGTTGTLRLARHRGDFVDNETLIATDAHGQTVTGGATVDGTLTWQTVTSSSGGSATWRAASSDNGNQIHVTNITGSFNNGDTLTFENGGTATMNGASVASDFVLCPTHNTTATSGTITPLSTPANRVAWTASFNAATQTPDSPWFDGPLVRQQERRMKLKKVSDNSDHPDLEVWFRVSRNKDGNIVHQEVNVLNPDITGKPRDYWYDAEILVGGVSQTTGDARYQHMHHQVFRSWRWRANKAFGMCDPGDFMKARCIHPWKRYPTWSTLAHIDCKVRGKQIRSDDNREGTHPVGYARATRNDPLQSANLDFSGNGGARGELGEFNSWEHFFWAGDSIEAWPAMEAMADNCAGNYGIHTLDRTATGADELVEPNLYLKWDVRPFIQSASFNRPGGTSTSETITQLYQLNEGWAGMNSHAPSIGTFTAYMACPEKRFFDLQQSWAYHLYCSTQSGQAINFPKTGGVAGDVDHILGYQSSNHERAYARPAREIFRASAIQHVGARRRTYWRRCAQDMANHANNQADRTIWGAFSTRSSPPITSNNPLPNSWVPGATFYWEQSPPDLVILDHFKSAYVNLSIWQAKDWNAADVDNFINKCLWAMRLFQSPPLNNQWLGVTTTSSNNSCLMLVEEPTWNGSEFVLPQNPKIWPTESMSNLQTWLGTFTAAQKAYLRIDQTLQDWIGTMQPGEANYALGKQIYGIHQAYVTYGTDPAWVAVAQSAMDYIDANAPITTLYDGLETAQFQQQLGFIPYANVTNW